MVACYMLLITGTIKAYVNDAGVKKTAALFIPKL